MPLRGRKRQDAQEALVSAKKLIIKVKKMGIDTAEAEEQYLEAKSYLRNKKYELALQGIEEAKKTIKAAYAKGIKGMLEIKINELEKKKKEMESKDLDASKPQEDFKKAKSALRGSVKELREGYKSAKEGLRFAESRLLRFNIISELIRSTQILIRPMEDYDTKISILLEIKERLDVIRKLVLEGRLKSAETEGKKLLLEVEAKSKRFQEARESIFGLKKAMQDADVLEANVDYGAQLQKAHELVLKGRFVDASKIANFHRNEISSLLNDFREAKHEMDLAKDKVVEVKGWGFSAFEAEKALNLAKEALKNHEFERTKKKSQESREMAGSIRERHKQSLELIQHAKEEIKSYNAQGNDIQDIEKEIKDADNLFNQGDYGASMEKIQHILGRIKKEG